MVRCDEGFTGGRATELQIGGIIFRDSLALVTLRMKILCAICGTTLTDTSVDAGGGGCSGRGLVEDRKH
jgi:hypothetical protein